MQHRDLFAMNAMKALIQVNGDVSANFNDEQINDITTLSYKFADAMLVKRKQKYPSWYNGKLHEK